VSGSKGALHEAKLLEGRLVRLIQRRDRQAAKAEADFLLDLLAELKKQPEWLIVAVRNALQYDKRQEALLVCINSVLAIDKRNREASAPVGRPIVIDGPETAAREFGVGSDTHLAAKRFHENPPPAPVQVLVDSDGYVVGVPDPSLPRFQYDPATVEPGAERLAAAGEAAVNALIAARYPEPGEPAVELPDGRVVAASPLGYEPEPDE